MKRNMIRPGGDLQQKNGEKFLETESTYVNSLPEMFPMFHRANNYVYSNYIQRWEILTAFSVCWLHA
jgi:hypothetical protein